MSPRFALVNIVALLAFAPPGPAQDWPRFRGPDGSGATDARKLPTEWSDEKNVLWKTAMPGPGASSAIVVGDRVFVASYSGYGLSASSAGNRGDLRLNVVCVDKSSGKVVWSKSVAADEKVKSYGGFIALHGYASSTPASDGKAIYAFFGPNGVFAYDLKGKLLWRKKLGTGTHGFGTANSPVVHGNLVLVNASVESGKLYALDKTTGDEVWSAPDIRESWNTPVVVKSGGGRQEIVLNTRGKIRAFDPKTGKELWHCPAINDYICPSVIAHDGIVYAIGGRSRTCIAVRSGGSGRVTPLWKTNAGSNVSSPVYSSGKLYWVSDKGIAICVDARDGSIVKQRRIRGTGRVYASVLLASDKLYAVSRESGTWVLGASDELEQIAHNTLDSDRSVFNASFAVSDGKMYLRSNKFLYCISASGAASR